MNELDVAKIAVKFCDGYLKDEAPVYIAEEMLQGNVPTEDQISFLAGFIEHVQKCWNDKVKSLEGNK